MLGRQGDPYGKFAIPPGVLRDRHERSKYMDNIFMEHKDSLTPYTKEDFEFPGVSVEGVTFSNRLETHFEEFHYSLINATDNTAEIADGKTEGMDFHLVIFVSDGAKDAAVDGLHESTTFNHYGSQDGTYPDNQPHGYPLDRHVDDECIITGVSNFMSMDIKVYHIEE
ncbi:Hemocyanin C chain [Portunus trituberculatus]|uniref:Hemocyanin C chain n=1 Tax=Portunus trituberculatus TaxID=210409 RepID=A0A5B7F983_PORTR|nr:Hemocyanin C chain [Portunus trituberculatus]